MGLNDVKNRLEKAELWSLGRLLGHQVERPGSPGQSNPEAGVDPEQLTQHHFLKLWPEEECDACALDQRRRTSNHGQGLVAASCSLTPWEARVPAPRAFVCRDFLLIIFNPFD